VEEAGGGRARALRSSSCPRAHLESPPLPSQLSGFGALSKASDAPVSREGADGAPAGTGPPPADGAARGALAAPRASTPDGRAAPASGTADADEDESRLERQLGAPGTVAEKLSDAKKVAPGTRAVTAAGNATGAFGVSAGGAAAASAAYFQGQAKAGTPLRPAGPDAAQGWATPNNTILSDGSVAGGYADYGKPVKLRIEANVSGLSGYDKVTVCHFPSPALQGWGADPYTVRPLKLPPPAANLLLSKDGGNGFDFAAPPPGERLFGPGCVSYDARCSFGANGIPCSGHGVCASSLPNECICANGWGTCAPGSNGCETNINRDVNNCGACGRQCPGLNDPTKNMACCGGKCFDLNGDGGPTRACGRCGQNCFSINGNASCTAGKCALACNAGFSPCQASSVFTTLNLLVPICVDTSVNPLFCGNCTTRCPFDVYGRTTCGLYGGSTPQCKVTCSWSYPTQCGTIATSNLPGTIPTSNCVNTQNDINNCGGCGVRCPRGVGATSTCAVSSVTGRPACSFDCAGGLVPCRVGNSFFCADIFGFDSLNCGGCGVVCGSGNICFQGTCVPNFVGFGDFGFGLGFFALPGGGGGGGRGGALPAGLDSNASTNASAPLARAARPPAPLNLTALTARLDTRPREVRPDLLIQAANGTGDVAVFPSYPARLDGPAGAPRPTLPTPATSPAAAAKLAKYLAERPELTSAAGEVIGGEPVLEAQGDAGAKRAARARARRAAAATATPPPGAHIMQCSAPEFDGPQPVVVARASLPPLAAGAIKPAPPPGPGDGREAFEKLGRGAAAPSVAPAADFDIARAAAAGVIDAADLAAMTGGAPGPASARPAAASASYGGFVAPGTPEAAAALARVEPAPGGDDSAAAWAASASLAHELEAAADGRGVASQAQAPAVAKPTPAATPAPTAKPAPAKPAPPASIADSTSTAAARREADAAAALPGAAERAGPAARRGDGGGVPAAAEPTGALSSFPRDVAAAAGGGASRG